ncbi:MAG: hypothetical protein WCD57_17425 [Acidobacteriaceae bacterium]
MPDHSQFNTDRTHPGRWTITFDNPPTAAELQSSIDLFFPLLALPGAQARRAKVRNIGYGVRSDFELNLGRYLPSFGRTGDDGTDTHQ